MAVKKCDTTQVDSIAESVENSRDILRLLRGKKEDRLDLGMVGDLKASMEAGERRGIEIKDVQTSIKEVQHAIDSEDPPGLRAQIRKNNVAIATNTQDIGNLKTSTERTEASVAAVALVAAAANSAAENLVKKAEGVALEVKAKAAEEALAIKAKAADEVDEAKAKAAEEALQPKPLFQLSGKTVVLAGKATIGIGWLAAAIYALTQISPRFAHWLEIFKSTSGGTTP